MLSVDWIMKQAACQVDLAVYRSILCITMQDAGNSMQTDLDGDGDVIYVWGTNLTIASVTKGIRRFYTTFRTPDQREDDDPKYLGLIRQVRGLCCRVVKAELGMCGWRKTALQRADPAVISSVRMDAPSAKRSWCPSAFCNTPQVVQAPSCCLDAQAIDNEDPVLNVDCANIADSDPTLYSHLLSCPTEVIPLMDTEARNLAAALGGDEADHHIQVRAPQGVELVASRPVQ